MADESNEAEDAAVVEADSALLTDDEPEIKLILDEPEVALTPDEAEAVLFDGTVDEMNTQMVA